MKNNKISNIKWKIIGTIFTYIIVFILYLISIFFDIPLDKLTRNFILILMIIFSIWFYKKVR